MQDTLRIAIDGNEANVTNRVGSNVYAYQILESLERLTQNQPQIKVTVLLAQEATADLPKAREGWEYQVVSPKPLWTQWALPIHLYLNKSEYDVFFTPGHYAPRASSIPYVSSVMDLAFVHFPDQFKKKDLLQLKNWTKYSVKNAKKIIAISKFTKEDIIKTHKIDTNKIVVAYPAAESKKRISKKRTQIILKEFGITQPFFLHLGTIQPRKNLITLVESFESICRSLKSGALKQKTSQKKLSANVQLVLAGKVGWLADEILERVKSSPFSEQIILTGFIDDRTKQALIQETVSLIQIGIYEGFGIPPLEALQLGTVPIVSKTTSLPEVIGSAGFQVNPTSSFAVAKAMKSALTMTARDQAKFRRMAKHKARSFDWNESAAIILETLKEVAAKPVAK